MTEINDSPFLQDKKYLLTHDLCDIPGLSEYQENNENLNNESKNEEKNSLNNEESRIKEMKQKLDALEDEEKADREKLNKKNKTQINNKEDDIYYSIRVEENTYLSEIFKILKEYIDGAIIVLSIQKYYFEANFELIVRLYTIINKEINNFLIILNKMDLSTNPMADLINVKDYLCSIFLIVKLLI